MSKKLTEFPPEAIFFDAEESEVLTCESPEEAVERRLDTMAYKESDMLALIREHSPMEVYCYGRKSLSATEIEYFARRAFEDLTERVDEEYGDPEGYRQTFTDEHRARLTECITAICKEADLWQCDLLGTVTLTAEQVEAMMREHCPEWFEEDDDASR